MLSNRLTLVRDWICAYTRVYTCRSYVKTQRVHAFYVVAREPLFWAGVAAVSYPWGDGAADTLRRVRYMVYRGVWLRSWCVYLYICARCLCVYVRSSSDPITFVYVYV